MADLIKKIKIKKQDGTFTDYIPIGADAANVATLDGESVQLKLNKKPYYYTNVASMKADTKLKAGDMAITLGYYEANDGGGAEYQIVDNSELVDDGGSIHTLNNNLKASLIINNINIKHFGAYGDNIHDDTEAIQKTIDYIDDLTTVSTIYTISNEIVVPTGKYKITQKITMPPYIKLRCQMAVFKSLVDDDATLSVEYTKAITDNTNYYLSKASYMNGDIISGGLTIVYEGEEDFGDTTNTNIGLSVGNSSSSISNPTARCRFSDVSIYNFSVGLLVNRINTYIIDFNHFHLEHNYTDIKIGDGEFARMTNSGENVTFNNCVIAGAVYGYYMNTQDFFSVIFNDCSIDYNACDFYFPHYTTTNTIVNGGHIESFGYYNSYLPNVDEDSLPAFGCIGYYGGTRDPNGLTTLKFYGTWIQPLSTNYKTNRFKAAVKDIFGVGFYGTRWLMNNDSSVEDAFICDKNVQILNTDYSILFPHDVSRNELLLSQTLDSFSVDDMTELSTSTNDVKAGYRIGNTAQLSLWSIDTTETGVFSTKVLKFTPGASTSNLLLYRKIFAEGHRKLVITPVVKSSIMTSLKLSIGYKFYDRSGTEIGARDTSTDNIVKYVNASNSSWNKASSAFIIEIPTQCDYVEASLYVQKIDATAFGSGNAIYINGLFMNLVN